MQTCVLIKDYQYKSEQFALIVNNYTGSLYKWLRLHGITIKILIIWEKQIVQLLIVILNPIPRAHPTTARSMAPTHAKTFTYHLNTI